MESHKGRHQSREKCVDIFGTVGEMQHFGLVTQKHECMCVCVSCAQKRVEFFNFL